MSPKPPPPPPRAQTSPGDRDVLRPKTPPAGVAEQLAAPESAWDDLTGKCERGEIDEAERNAERSKRPTDQRLTHVEQRNDAQDSAIATLVTDVAFIKGQLVVLPSLVAQAIQGTGARQHLQLKVDADLEVARGKSEISDELDAKKSRRKVLTKIGTVIAGGIGAWLLHLLLARLGL